MAVLARERHEDKTDRLSQLRCRAGKLTLKVWMGPGQRAMAPVKTLSDVDSDSTCTQQQASGAHLSPTARHTLARRETLAGCALTLLHARKQATGTRTTTLLYSLY